MRLCRLIGGLVQRWRCWCIMILFGCMQQIDMRMWVLTRFWPSGRLRNGRCRRRRRISRLAARQWRCVHTAPFAQRYRSHRCDARAGWHSGDSGAHATLAAGIVRRIVHRHRTLCIQTDIAGTIWRRHVWRAAIHVRRLRLIGSINATTHSFFCFGHCCDGCEFFHHRIMPEGALNRCRRMPSTDATIFALQQFNLLIQQILWQFVSEENETQWTSSIIYLLNAALCHQQVIVCSLINCMFTHSATVFYAHNHRIAIRAIITTNIEFNDKMNERSLNSRIFVSAPNERKYDAQKGTIQNRTIPKK